ncbi:MAG: DUF2807 domain-containing protein [Mucilaginibacter polytrichastri]|nr:DUF2807 domain-containing protein [Mucilaginibacter polytrichastri]
MINHFRYLLAFLFLLPLAGASAQTKSVNPFTKIIVSQHVQATFVEGDKESVTIEKCTVDPGKLHIESDGGVLRVHLEGAKDIEKNEKVTRNGQTERRSLYTGTVVTATITYKTLRELSIRGGETQLCKSPIKGDDFRITVYGESNVTFSSVQLEKLQGVLYGESTLEFQSGSIGDQRYTAYGEGVINSLAVKGNSARLMAYGEAVFRMNVSGQITIKALGEAKLEYKGNPSISKGLHIGDLHISKLD